MGLQLSKEMPIGVRRMKFTLAILVGVSRRRGWLEHKLEVAHPQVVGPLKQENHQALGS